MKVEIYTVDRFDVESRNVYRLWKGKDIDGIFPIKVSKFYDIGCSDAGLIRKIAEEILVDPVVERYRIREKDKTFEKDWKFVVEIFLKEGVSDVVGESVSDIIEKMFSEKFVVRTGRCFYLKFLDDFVDFAKEEYFNPLINGIELKRLQ